MDLVQFVYFFSLSLAKKLRSGIKSIIEHRSLHIDKLDNREQSESKCILHPTNSQIFLKGIVNIGKKQAEKWRKRSFSQAK